MAMNRSMFGKSVTGALGPASKKKGAKPFRPAGKRGAKAMPYPKKGAPVRGAL